MRNLFETHVREVTRCTEKALESQDPVMALGYLYLLNGRLQAAQRDMVTEAQDAAVEVNR